MHPRRPSFSLLLDLGPVLAIGIVGVLVSRFPSGETERLTYLLVVLPLVLRRYVPFITLVIVALGAVLTGAHDAPSPWIQVVSVALAGFSLGEDTPDRMRSVLFVLLVAALTAAGFLAQDASPVLSVSLPFVILMPAWLVGDAVRTRREEAAARAAATERALRDRDAQLAAAAADERRRIAREMHDIVSHTVSVMQVQAGAARQVVRSSPDDAERALLTIEQTGREAMTELRSLLGALSDEDEGPGLAPEPGTEQLGALLARVRDSGLPAELEIAGEPRPLPSALDTTLYRIVQEALTNALRYARRARTIVRLTYEPAQVRVEVLDDGPGVIVAAVGRGGTPGEAGSALDPGSSAGGAGRGLIGMRERAATAGGRLEAGPRIGGGYAVRAWLPLPPLGRIDG